MTIETLRDLVDYAQHMLSLYGEDTRIKTMGTFPVDMDDVPIVEGVGGRVISVNPIVISQIARDPNSFGSLYHCESDLDDDFGDDEED